MATLKVSVRRAVAFHMAAQAFPILPVKAAFKIGMIGAAVAPVVEQYQKQRAAIMTKLGIPAPAKPGDPVALTPEAETEVNALLDIEQDVNYTALTVDDFIDPHGGTREVSPALMAAVGMFFDAG